MKTKLKPGWKMTQDQHRSYWYHLNRAYKSYNSGTARPACLSREAFRALIHHRAFGRNLSAKDIDRLKMFGALKATCMAIIKPDNLAAQMAIAIANDPRSLLIHRILEFPASYVLSLISSPRFAHCSSTALEDLEDWDRWTEKDLTDLRNTLCARNPAQPQTKTRAPDEPSLEPF